MEDKPMLGFTTYLHAWAPRFRCSVWLYSLLLAAWMTPWALATTDTADDSTAQWTGDMAEYDLDGLFEVSNNPGQVAVYDLQGFHEALSSEQTTSIFLFNDIQITPETSPVVLRRSVSIHGMPPGTYPAIDFNFTVGAILLGADVTLSMDGVELANYDTLTKEASILPHNGSEVDQVHVLISSSLLHRLGCTAADKSYKAMASTARPPDIPGPQNVTVVAVDSDVCINRRRICSRPSIYMGDWAVPLHIGARDLLLHVLDTVEVCDVTMSPQCEGQAPRPQNQCIMEHMPDETSSSGSSGGGASPSYPAGYPAPPPPKWRPPRPVYRPQSNSSNIKGTPAPPPASSITSDKVTTVLTGDATSNLPIILGATLGAGVGLLALAAISYVWYKGRQRQRGAGRRSSAGSVAMLVLQDPHSGSGPSPTKQVQIDVMATSAEELAAAGGKGSLVLSSVPTTLTSSAMGTGMGMGLGAVTEGGSASIDMSAGPATTILTSSSGGRPLQLQMDRGPSQSIRLSQVLGVGSFGKVYSGAWRNQLVAVKVIAHSELAAQRVQQEVELCQSFMHPNVVRSLHYEIHDMDPSQVAVNDSTRSAVASMETFIVMEYCDGGALASQLDKYARAAAVGDDPCSHLEEVMQLSRDIAAGMAYLHSMNICHGDLKCENVLLSSIDRERPDTKMVAKVADFGLSRVLSEASTHLSTATVGTVTHMPPELLLTGRMKPSCDVYSFGIMLWQLLVGDMPFAQMRYAEVVYKVTVANLRPEFPPFTPSAYRRLAEECWQSEEAKRPTFVQIQARLSDMLADITALRNEAKPKRAAKAAMDPPFTPPPAPLPADDLTLQSPWIMHCNFDV